MLITLLINFIIALLWVGCGIGVVCLWVFRYRKLPFMKLYNLESFKFWIKRNIITICFIIFLSPVGLFFCISVEISLLIIYFCGKKEKL